MIVEIDKNKDITRMEGNLQKIDRKFIIIHSLNSNLVLFFEVWNTYNRENIENYFYSRVNKDIGKIVYFSTIPVVGLGIEF